MTQGGGGWGGAPMTGDCSCGWLAGNFESYICVKLNNTNKTHSYSVITFVGQKGKSVRRETYLNWWKSFYPFSFSSSKTFVNILIFRNLWIWNSIAHDRMPSLGIGIKSVDLFFSLIALSRDVQQICLQARKRTVWTNTSWREKVFLCDCFNYVITSLSSSQEVAIHPNVPPEYVPKIFARCFFNVYDFTMADWKLFL